MIMSYIKVTSIAGDSSLYFMVEIYFTLDLVMKSRGITKAELSRLTGFNFPTVDRLYRGDFQRIEIGTLEKLCDALDVLPGDLLKIRSQPASETIGEDDITRMLIDALVASHLDQVETARKTRDARIKDFMSNVEAAIRNYLEGETLEFLDFEQETTVDSVHRILELSKALLPKDDDFPSRILEMLRLAALPEKLLGNQPRRQRLTEIMDELTLILERGVDDPAVLADIEKLRIILEPGQESDHE